VFPMRYELNIYMVFRRNSVFKGLKVEPLTIEAASFSRQNINKYLPDYTVSHPRISLDDLQFIITHCNVVLLKTMGFSYATCMLSDEH
jgi:hypothetical protein